MRHVDVTELSKRLQRQASPHDVQVERDRLDAEDARAQAEQDEDYVPEPLAPPNPELPNSDESQPAPGAHPLAGLLPGTTSPRPDDS